MIEKICKISFYPISMERFFKFLQLLKISWMSSPAASSPISFHLKHICKVSRRSSDLIPAASSVAPAYPILLCLSKKKHKILNIFLSHLPPIKTLFIDILTFPSQV